MKVIKAKEGAIYCQNCVGRLSRRTPSHLAIRFPASHDEDKKGTCWGCRETVDLQKASKVVRREKR